MKPFNWSVYTCADISFLALYFPTTRISPRIASLVVLAEALFYTYRCLTLFSPGEDYGLGTTSSGILLCAAFHVVFLDRDFPNGLRRAQDDTSPSGFSFSRKLSWMWGLGANVRRIGLNGHSIHRVTPFPRWKFVISRLSWTTVSFILFQVSVAYTNGTPLLILESTTIDDRLYITRKRLVLRSVDVMLWATHAIAGVTLLQTSAAALSVALVLSGSPADWPSLFSSLLDTFTVRRFWK
jgi:hypothetical protein